MRFEHEKKATIIQYLLEKMDEKVPNVVKMVSETFEINQNTVHTYIKELLNSDTIRRVKRGTYELVTETSIYQFARDKGEIEEEQVIYDEYLQSHFKGFPRNVMSIWEYALGEIINNVIDHSEAKNLTITVKTNNLCTKISIVDNGVGIFKKIKDHFGFHSTDEAICELFKGKLTTDPDRHSGEGIFFTSKLVDRFVIISDGKIFTNNKYDKDDLTDAMYAECGTVVLMELSNSSNKIPSEIFNQYSQVDGGFTKTIIPLKNVFETAPVSRSQAKRICQRLEKFQEVILDFDGLEWMGQGFAHQIFIVFQNEYPEISLKPINMNDGVSQMYTHVTARSYE